MPADVPPPTRPKVDEGERGPIARLRAFLGERYAALQTRPDENAPTLMAFQEALGLPRGVSPSPVTRSLPVNFRLQLLQEYRARLRPRPAGRGQPLPPAPPPANNWIPLGPAGVRQGQGAVKPVTSGRVACLVVAPGGKRVYVGSANGGVWRSDDGGQSWRSLMEAVNLQPGAIASDSLSCGAMALVAREPEAQDRIYVGTGEGNGAAFFGAGLLVSDDGGSSWEREPSRPDLVGRAFFALAIDPANPDRVIAATNLGLYLRIADPQGSGFRWERQAMDSGGSCTSAVACRKDGVTSFFAAFYGGPVYRSADGVAWSLVGKGFPSLALTRVGLAVQPDNPDVVYALTCNGNDHLQGLYRYDVRDDTWHEVSGLPATLFGGDLGNRGQGWYDLAVVVDPTDVNRVYVGGAAEWAAVAGHSDWSGALYRCQITLQTAANGSLQGASALCVPLGESVHADLHALVFTPDDPGTLWVGCDGGVFRSRIPPTGTGPLFESCNLGLATLMMTHFGQHPTEDAVLFAGTQDNGCVRYTGEEAWLYSAPGDSGYAVINWGNPYQILSSYTYGTIRFSDTGGGREGYTSVSVPLEPSEDVEFYAPLVGTPYNLAAPSEADLVAFGSVRPWLSEQFGKAGWHSIPTGTLARDTLNGRLRTLLFASATKLYAGTITGGVYRFDRTATGWVRFRLHAPPDGSLLPLQSPVTSLAVDLLDPSGNSLFIAFGGSQDYRHVWHFDGTTRVWEARSGPAGPNQPRLLDAQHNALATDPKNPKHLYAAADLGVWRSMDSGGTWDCFSEGLPESAVVDLQLHPRRLLRAATFGRGVFERTLDDGPKQEVELYIRHTVLDRGRWPCEDNLPDPTSSDRRTDHTRSPDIKVLLSPPPGLVSLAEFVDTLGDQAERVPQTALAKGTAHVFVLLHNQGVVPASGVRLLLLLAEAEGKTAVAPALPANYPLAFETGEEALAESSWRLVGSAELAGLRVGFPVVAPLQFSLAVLQAPPAGEAERVYFLLALLHHTRDAYGNGETNPHTLGRRERKAALRRLSVV